MAKIEIVIPQMGEGIIEATITRWIKNPGDQISEEEPIVEIATDKVDSEITAPASGFLSEQLFKEGETAPVGKIIAYILSDSSEIEIPAVTKTFETTEKPLIISAPVNPEPESKSELPDTKYISPLVRNIAREENISLNDISKITGTGNEGRVTKDDLLTFINSKKEIPSSISITNKGDEIIEMDRMRRLIADHMVHSKQVSPHVTSFAEADVTNLVKWREQNKQQFEKRENQKLTYTPVFIDIIAKALREFPQINASVDGYKIILKKNINIGIAVALPNGNLIVPVIKNADSLELGQLIKNVNDFSSRARNSKLIPDEIQNATFTLTNLGSFGSLAGTPIINQPQVAILATGAIKKRPVVIETESGDTIGIRHIMILSLAYDHRVVDGVLGGKFLNKVVELLEKFDITKNI
jgi:2-oxoglutarate dehydrogenase E2 component (dihydrolipoamide succinyltransferase)